VGANTQLGAFPALAIYREKGGFSFRAMTSAESLRRETQGRFLTGLWQLCGLFVCPQAKTVRRPHMTKVKSPTPATSRTPNTTAPEKPDLFDAFEEIENCIGNIGFLIDFFSAKGCLEVLRESSLGGINHLLWDSIDRINIAKITLINTLKTMETNNSDAVV
jgi:hypothetical protein